MQHRKLLLYDWRCSTAWRDNGEMYRTRDFRGSRYKAIFIDTPLDVALVRRVWRDMSDASGEEIRNDLELYLKYARIAFVQMQKDVMPSSDYVLDGTLGVDDLVEEILALLSKC